MTVAVSECRLVGCHFPRHVGARSGRVYNVCDRHFYTGVPKGAKYEQTPRHSRRRSWSVKRPPARVHRARSSDQITADWKACQSRGGCVPGGDVTLPRPVPKLGYVPLAVCVNCGVPIPARRVEDVEQRRAASDERALASRVTDDYGRVSQADAWLIDRIKARDDADEDA